MKHVICGLFFNLQCMSSGVVLPEFPSADFRVTGNLGNAQCVAEAETALAAKKAVENLINDTQEDLTVIDINVFLIYKGYAVEVTQAESEAGEGVDWCE